MGMRARTVAAFSSSGDSPAPSLPTRKATGPRRSVVVERGLRLAAQRDRRPARRTTTKAARSAPSDDVEREVRALPRAQHLGRPGEGAGRARAARAPRPPPPRCAGACRRCPGPARPRGRGRSPRRRGTGAPRRRGHHGEDAGGRFDAAHRVEERIGELHDHGRAAPCARSRAASRGCAAERLTNELRHARARRRGRPRRGARPRSRRAPRFLRSAAEEASFASAL